MLVKKEVSFLHGNILTKEMLNEMYAYPRNFIELKYSDYSDGIIAGLDFIENSGITYLTKGIVKFKGEYYFLLDDINLTSYFLEMHKQQNWSTKLYYLYLKSSTPIKVDSIIVQNLDLYVSEECKQDDLFLLCRFYGGKDNMELPQLNGNEEKEPFKKLTDDNLYVNMIDTLYAMPGKATYHPFLFKAVAEYLEQKPNKSILDNVILMQIQNMKVLSIDAMETYIYATGYNNEKNLDRESFFDLFVKCLKKKEDVSKISSENNKEKKVSKARYNGPKGMLI
ncbi:hypothetical protein [Megamonas hypermegale]|uniref:hypothetical protein n=1 Tax=Megamonas hypermegale TaxID=158847 RepID=UPI003207BD6D